MVAKPRGAGKVRTRSGCGFGLFPSEFRESFEDRTGKFFRALGRRVRKL